MSGYQIFRNDEANLLHSRPYHGLVLFVKKDIVVCKFVKFHNPKLEFIFAKLKYDNGHIVQVAVVYKYPICSLNDFKKYVINNLVPLVDVSNALVILGDFNFDINDGHTNFLKFMHTTFVCSQLIEKVTTDYQTKLDLIFTNVTDSYSDVIEAYWSDHKMIYCVIEPV